MYSNNNLRECPTRRSIKSFSKKELFQKIILAFLEGTWYCSSVNSGNEHIRHDFLQSKRVVKINITALKIEVYLLGIYISGSSFKEKEGVCIER